MKIRSGKNYLDVGSDGCLGIGGELRSGPDPILDAIRGSVVSTCCSLAPPPAAAAEFGIGGVPLRAELCLPGDIGNHLSFEIVPEGNWLPPQQRYSDGGYESEEIQPNSLYKYKNAQITFESRKADLQSCGLLYLHLVSVAEAAPGVIDLGVINYGRVPIDSGGRLSTYEEREVVITFGAGTTRKAIKDAINAASFKGAPNPVFPLLKATLTETEMVEAKTALKPIGGYRLKLPIPYLSSDTPVNDPRWLMRNCCGIYIQYNYGFLSIHIRENSGLTLRSLIDHINQGTIFDTAETPDGRIIGIGLWRFTLTCTEPGADLDRSIDMLLAKLGNIGPIRLQGASGRVFFRAGDHALYKSVAHLAMLDLLPARFGSLQLAYLAPPDAPPIEVRLQSGLRCYSAGTPQGTQCQALQKDLQPTLLSGYAADYGELIAQDPIATLQRSQGRLLSAGENSDRSSGEALRILQELPLFGVEQGGDERYETMVPGLGEPTLPHACLDVFRRQQFLEEVGFCTLRPGESAVIDFAVPRLLLDAYEEREDRDRLTDELAKTRGGLLVVATAGRGNLALSFSAQNTGPIPEAIGETLLPIADELVHQLLPDDEEYGLVSVLDELQDYFSDGD